MQIKLLSLLFLGIQMSLFSQTNSDSVKYSAYKIFIGRILATNNTGLSPSFSLSSTTTPSINMSIPIVPIASGYSSYSKSLTKSDRSANNRIFLSAVGNIASANGYSGLVKGGEWLPDFKVGLNGTYIFKRVVNFYTIETTKFPYPSQFRNLEARNLHYVGPLDQDPITDASQLFFGWISISLGYRQTTNSLFDSIYRKPSKPIYKDTLKGVFFSGNINFYFYPSKSKTNWLSIYLQLGVDYLQRDANIDTAKLDNGTITSYSSTGNTVITHTKDFSSYDSSNYKHGYSVNVPLRALFLINPVEQLFFGIGYYANASIPQKSAFNLKPSCDMGFTISAPVNTGTGNDSKSVINMSLNFIWKDIGLANDNNGDSRKVYMKNNFNIGFTAAVPLIYGHKSDHKAP